MSSLASLLSNASPDADEVIKACNAALKQSKSDISAQHAKVVALLNLDRFEDAARSFKEFGDSLKNKAQLEHAYTLYKTGSLEDAKEVAARLQETGAKHLHAQASYRLEDFVNASQIYKQLWDAKAAHEESDLRINGGATDAQLQWARQGELVTKRKIGREDLEAFETAYNAACGCLARGELAQGEVLLKRAKDLCLSSELSEEEKKDELLPITVQQLYVLASLGKSEQADSLLKELSVRDIPDLSTRMIAEMNKLNTSMGPSNPFLSQRIISSYSNLPNTDQLFSFQSSIAKQNELALDLLASKFSGVASSTNTVISNSPSPTTSANVSTAGSLNAAAHAQNQLGKIGLKSMLPLLEKRPKDVGLLATIIQLYVLTNNFGAAVTVMEAFFKRLEESKTDADQDVRHAPGLIAIAVSLFSRVGRKPHVQAELAKAASYWRRKSKCPPELLRVAGLSLLSSDDEKDLKEAGQIFDTLQQQDSTDRIATAGLVAAYSQTEIAKVKSQVENLTAVNRLTAGIDVDALERIGVPQSEDTTTAIINRKRAAASATKPAKKRKSKLPKDYNPDKKPDPERWLPLRDRSTYRPKGKKGKQKQAALTQGGIEKDAPAEPAKPAPVPGGGGGGAKSKKKKGKK